jgi:hypothetical protein
MVKYLMARAAIAEPVAVERLETQGRAAPAVGELMSTLGASYGGAWFSPSTGRFNVGVVGGPSQPATAAVPQDAGVVSAQAVLEAHEVAAQTSFVSVSNSMADLEAAKAKIGAAVAGSVRNHDVLTGIAMEDNAVVVYVSDTISAQEEERIRELAASATVKVEVVSRPAESLDVTPAACKEKPWKTFNPVEAPSQKVLTCTRDLRGGQAIFDSTSGAICSLGYFVTSGTTEYVMTAGHCMEQEPGPVWGAASTDWTETNQHWQSFGTGASNYIGAEGDIGFIPVLTSSAWFPVGNPSQVASLNPSGPWGQNEHQTLENIAWPAEHDILCHTGTSTITQCGEIVTGGMNNGYTIEYKSGWFITIEHSFRTNFCAKKGDSGGTVWGNHSGMGMTDAINRSNYSACESGTETWNTEAIRELHFTTGGTIKFYVPPYGEL